MLVSLEVQLAQYREQMEARIKEHGYEIQFVRDNDDSFAHTIGRNDRLEKDFIVRTCGAHYDNLVHEVVKLDSEGSLTENTIYETKALAGDDDPTMLTRYRVKPVKIADVDDFVLGIIVRYTKDRLPAIQLWEIEVAGENNLFPEEINTTI